MEITYSFIFVEEGGDVSTYNIRLTSKYDVSNYNIRLTSKYDVNNYTNT